MSRGPRGLALRLYLVTLAQFLTVLVAALLLHRLTLGAPPGPPHHAAGRYALEQIAAHVADPHALQLDLARARRELRADVTVYSRTGTVVASNVEPPLPPWASEDGPPPPRTPDGPPGKHGHGRPLMLAAEGGAQVILAMGPPPPRPVGPLVWGVLLALVIVGVASVMLARSLARPLGQLTAAAREIGRGNLAVRVKLERSDELGELSNAFDDMTERLSLLLRAQQELMANVSHELRTPLARIGVALDLAAEGDAAMAREALGEIAEDVAELQRLVADVLRMARLDLAEGRTHAGIPPVRPEVLDPTTLIEKAVVRFRSAHPDRTLELIADGGLPSVSADPVLFRRVIDNLLDNARKYSEGPVVLRAGVAGGGLLIAVEDRGIGIAPQDLAHVTSPFFRTDRSRARKTGGLGLGLSLARRITEAHGGALTVESEIGVGTTVRVRLPPFGGAGAPTPSGFHQVGGAA